MAFLKNKVHIDVVELSENDEAYNVLVDFYYAHQESIKEDYVPNEDGETETVIVEGFEADGWRYRLSVLKEHVTNIKELKEELKQEYQRKGIEHGYSVDEVVEIQLPNGTV